MSRHFMGYGAFHRGQYCCEYQLSDLRGMAGVCSTWGSTIILKNVVYA